MASLYVNEFPLVAAKSFALKALDWLMGRNDLLKPGDPFANMV